MNWKVPPRIKVYEALGCLADERMTVSGNGATVASSSRGKSYTVRYDHDHNAIMANDNGSYWQGYLGYPSIAFLFAKNILPFRSESAALLKDIPWKDVNVRFKNNYAKTEEYVLETVRDRGGDADRLAKEVDAILEKIEGLNLAMLGEKVKPPSGY